MMLAFHETAVAVAEHAAAVEGAPATAGAPARRRAPKPVRYEPVTVVLSMLAQFGQTRASATFAADVALLAGVSEADIAACLRIGLILTCDGIVVGWRRLGELP